MNTVIALIKTFCVIFGKRFTKSQKEQIYSGFIKCNLTFKQVKFYARLEFSGSKMRAIKLALFKGISEEKLKAFDLVELSSYIVYLVVHGYERGLSKDEISTYAKSDIDEFEAFKIFCDLKQKK